MVLLPGSLLVDRFKIDRLAGEGGMGKVYRAQDLTSGRWVAVKQLQGAGSAEDAERLIREARLLLALRHPGIVAYIDHGHTADGAPYLTTEWLDGEDLECRLQRAPLSIGDTLLLLERIAEPLAQAHKHGVIHRDIKPSNLFLVDGQIERLKLLDFGIARRLVGSTQRTRTGLIVGTPEYMAPEQARGMHELTPSVDVFALGCVLYECLTGRPPFTAEHVTAILIRILFELPEPLDRLVPEAPAGLVSLVHRMLAKEPAERPRDAAEVLLALQSLRSPRPRTQPGPAVPEAPPLAGAARQLISMVLAVPRSPDPALVTTAPDLPLLRTLEPGAPHSGERDSVAQIRQQLEASGGRVELLLDGSLTVIYTQSGSMTATDLAVQAARGALLLKEKERSPKMQVAMTTSRSAQRQQQPYREAIASAERLLASAPLSAPGSEGCVHIDGVTAGLLDGSFEVRVIEPGHALLLGERTSLDESRPLLGRPTPCVGRDQDLVMLDSILTSCVEDPSARAVLITAPPGVGKSRLRHEFLRRLRARGQSNKDITILIGRGDAMSAGASYGLLGQALRRLCGVLDGAPAEVRCGQLLQRIGRSFPIAPESEGRRIAEFLGELCGVPFPAAASPALRAARQDPFMMSERIGESFLRFLSAELRTQPLLLVLEDLHWGDALTVRLIDAALRDLADLPLMVLALARPEIKGLFPGIWEGRQRQEIALGPLSRRACERLVAQVLGAQASPDRVARIVARAGGNALFLEELIRAAADDKGDELPETILAMLHARFARLDERTRSVLHAASVFGETFWRGGVLALTGSSFAEPIDRCLQVLLHAEIIEPHAESRLVDEVEYKFRHALVRDAAYGLLTEQERVLAHHAAGRYLEAAGESDPMGLAEHYERGQALVQAARLYSRAAEQAHWGGDTPSAIARAQRGLRCDPSVSGQAALLSLLAEAYGWSGDFRTGSRFAEQAFQTAIPGSRPWASCLATLQTWALMSEDAEGLRRYTDTLVTTPPLPGALETMAFAMLANSYTNELANRVQEARKIVHRLESLWAGEPGSLLARAWLDLSRAFFCVHLAGDPAAALGHAQSARLAFEEAGHRRGALTARIAAGLSLWRLGRSRAAKEELVATLDSGADFGPITPQRDAVLICVLAESGDLSAARRLLGTQKDSARASGRPMDQGLAHWAQAEVLRRAGELPAAESAAREAIEQLRGIELHRLAAELTLSAILLGLQRPAEALAVAEAVLARHHEAGSISFRSGLARLICAEARHALGDPAGARALLTESRALLLATAAGIPDPDQRQSFLSHVPEHGRTLALLTS